MEIYSTVLWHLRKEVELSYLAHELIEFDKLVPESWCVVGNCFSLLKEHESAVKFFQRVDRCYIFLCLNGIVGPSIGPKFHIRLHAVWP
jgi:hypothetical protein